MRKWRKAFLTLAVAFLTMISVWSGIGMEVRAEGRTLEESSLKKGDMLYAGDTIVFHLNEQLEKQIKRVCVYCMDPGINEGTMLFADYVPGGIEVTLREKQFLNDSTGYKYSKYKYRDSRVYAYSSEDWMFFIDVVKNEESGGNAPGESGSGENKPGSGASDGDSTGTIPSKENDAAAPAGDTSTLKTDNAENHICNFQWSVTKEPTLDAEGLEEYKCAGCGAVQAFHSISRNAAVVNAFYKNVTDAPANGTVTYDSGKLYTISDYLLKKMAERKDVAVTVRFEYKGAGYELTFPAGMDYSVVLADKETMYGYFGVAAKLGLKVAAR